MTEMPHKSIEYDCGIAIGRIASWLDSDLVLLRSKDGSWLFPILDASCRITLSELEKRQLGKVGIERTRMVVTGDDTAIEAYLRLFTLQFISAGG